MSKAHLFNLCNGEKIGKVNEKLQKNSIRYLIFDQVFHCFNFDFGHSFSFQCVTRKIQSNAALPPCAYSHLPYTSLHFKHFVTAGGIPRLLISDGDN